MNEKEIILADPPWDFTTYSNKARRSAKRHYPTMSLEEICALPIADLTAENAALFMWVTWPNLEWWLPVIEAWGFTYRTVAFIWVKMNPSGVGFHTGLGYYTRSNTEPCLLAVKGHMIPEAHDVSELIMTPRQEHSRKPDEQYHRIERLYPARLYPNRLELFARRRWPGWDVFGNEVEGSIELAQIAPESEYASV